MQVNINLNTIIISELIKSVELLEARPRTLREMLIEDPAWLLRKVPELCDNREIVLFAVKQDGTALEYASDRLKDDKEIVLAAVKEYGWALLHASDRLKDDQEIVLAAVKQDGWALAHASARLQKEFAGFKP